MNHRALCLKQPWHDVKNATEEHSSRFCATAACTVSFSQLEPARVEVLSHRAQRTDGLLFNGPLTQLSVLCCDCSMLPVRCVEMRRQ